MLNDDKKLVFSASSLAQIRLTIYLDFYGQVGNQNWHVVLLDANSGS